eukprot:SAG31_NODE_2657_length_5286_cov_7.817235_7_plen_78_part_00
MPKPVPTVVGLQCESGRYVYLAVLELTFALGHAVVASLNVLFLRRSGQQGSQKVFVSISETTPSVSPDLKPMPIGGA